MMVDNAAAANFDDLDDFNDYDLDDDFNDYDLDDDFNDDDNFNDLDDFNDDDDDDFDDDDDMSSCSSFYVLSKSQSLISTCLSNPSRLRLRFSERFVWEYYSHHHHYPETNILEFVVASKYLNPS